jgi:small subunit ribosomal protein S9
MADEVINKAVEAATQTAAVREKKPSPYIWGVGRRKTSVARVRIKAGSGVITINKRPLDEFFKLDRDRNAVRSALEAANLAKAYDVWASVNGGGTTGQSDAVKLGIARAMLKVDANLVAALRDKNLLTRDARMKERKKYGQKGARKRFQFSKR